MAVMAESQMHMEEQQIESESLEHFCEQIIRTKEAVSLNRRMKKELKKVMNGRPAGRYRINGFVIDWQPMEGGGFEVAPWATMAARISG